MQLRSIIRYIRIIYSKYMLYVDSSQYIQYTRNPRLVFKIKHVHIQNKNLCSKASGN